MKRLLAALAALAVTAALAGTACGRDDDGGVIKPESTTTVSNPSRY